MNRADKEAEFLGTLIVNPGLVAEASQILEPDDLTDARVKMAYTAMLGLVDAGTELDAFAVARHMSSNQATQANIVRWFAKASDGIPFCSSVASLARWLRRRATVARAQHELAVLAERAQAASASGDDAEWMETEVAGLAIELSRRDDHRLRRVRYADLEEEIAAYFHRLAHHQLDPRAIPTGIEALDRRLGGGLQPGKLHLIASQTGGGKTTFASQIADHAASLGRRALLFTMEVDPLDVAIRDTERVARRSRWDLVRGTVAMRESALEDLTEAVGSIVHATAACSKVMFGSSVSVEEIYRAVMVEGMRMGGPVELVVVDHAQVVAPGKTKAAKSQTPTRYLEMKVIAEKLREFATAKNFACVLTAQMNPSPKGERPSMALIRESKDMANTSDLVLILHHERETEVQPAHATGRPRIGRIVSSEVLIEKGRTAALGHVPVQYDGSHFRYSDVQGGDEE